MLKPRDGRNPWKTVSTAVRYQNPWITIREDQVIRPDGNPGIYGVVEARFATGVIARNQQGEIYLVGQYRYPTQQYSWEIIEGGAEAGEDPRVAAARELREEAGLEAQRWQVLGADIQLSNCFSAEMARLFVAEELSSVPAQPEGTEVLEVRTVSLQDAVYMVDSGEITDAMSVIGLLRYARMVHA